MREHECYHGFPPLPRTEDILARLVHSPPDHRWRTVRDLFRVADSVQSEGLAERIRACLGETEDFRVRYRLELALTALASGRPDGSHVLVRGRGAFPSGEWEKRDETGGRHTQTDWKAHLSPIIDFHVHPQAPDLKFFSDMRQAGVTYAVILATDTDPEDLERPEILDRLRRSYQGCSQSRDLPFERLIALMRAALYPPTHVSNRDVADWVADYPEILIGFGSVNLSKDRAYVEAKLAEIERLRLRGVKLMPYSQFFSPADNENVDLLFQYCRAAGSIVISHTGCGAGPFDMLELSRDAHPGLWEPVVRKYPDVPLVLAHCGSYSHCVPGIWLCEALQLGKKYKSVYADLASTEWLLDSEMVAKEIRKTIGFDRILFGTDYPWPLTEGMSLAYLVGALKANHHLTEREKRNVLGGNAARLLGLG